MLALEEELIYAVNCGNKKEALEVYQKLSLNLKSHDLGNGCYLNSIKNHIICLNSILYKNACDNITFKKSIHIKRNNFTNEIEGQTSVEDLFKLGERIICFYIDTVTKESICVENPIIKEALTYIHNNISEDLTLDKVATGICISKNYLCNLFKKSIGCSISNYINKVKIEKSKIILKSSNRSLLDVSIECGFNSQSYFCYTFKKITGFTPTEYQRLTIKDSVC